MFVQSCKYFHQCISVMAGALTFFALGNQLGAVNPYLDKLQIFGYYNIKQISIETRSGLVLAQTLGIIPGAVIAPHVNDILGRKYTMMLMAIPAFLAQIFVYFAAHISMVYIYLILLGTITAWAFAIIPTYISEISSAHLRGPFTVLSILFMSIGMYAGNEIQTSYSIESTAITAAIEILVICLITFLVSETPYYFLSKNQDKECKQSLRKFRCQDYVDEEYEEIKSIWNESLKAKQFGWVNIFTVRSNLKVFLICAGAQTIQQFTGQIIMSANIIIIVLTSGLNLPLTKIPLLTNGIGIVATAIGIFIVDSWGRRPLLMFVCIGACIGHFLVGLGFLLVDQTGVPNTALGVTELIGNLTYLAMLGLGLLHLPIVLGAELFPTGIKSRGISLIMVLSSLEGLLVAQLFDSFSKVGFYLPFWVMAVCAILGLIFGIICVPETKNRSLEDIQKQFNLVIEEESKPEGVQSCVI